MDIKEVTFIKGCFGEDILIDGKNLNDVPREQIMEWMFNRIKSCQQYDLIETFKHLAWSDYHDCEHVYHDKCDQCGDWNSKEIIKFNEE